MTGEAQAGYKRTDVGVIPENWKVQKISELGQIKTGPFGTLLKADEYSENHGVPLISVGEIGEGEFRVTANTPRIPAGVVRRLPQYVLKENDIVFGRKGAVDRSVIVTSRQAGWFLGSDGISLRIASGYAPFIAWQFQTSRVRSWLLQNAVGTTMASLNQAVLGSVGIPVAPIGEQELIASVLSDIADLINGLDQLIAKKRDIQQAAMQELLTGQRRLPGFSREWEVKRLGNFLEIKKGQLITEMSAVPGHVPVIAGGKKPSYFHNQSNRTGKTITISASGASAGYVAFFDCPIFASDCSTISESETYSIKFLYYQLVARQSQIYKAQTGGAQPHIHASDLAPMEIGVCGKEEQTAIATILSDMDDELTALEARRDKARHIKQAMMQELLTGRIRLM